VASVSQEEGVSLNLMPMLDIFSILITFLLMSYSTDPVSYDISAGLELPDSVTITALDELPSIIVTKNEIMVNDKKVATILGGDVPEKDRSQGAVYPVFVELEKLAEANKRVFRGKEDKTKTSVLTMEMDQSHQFKLMKRIMLAAQQAEFVTFKLMVAREGE
jgi:hypothetical protein